MRLSLNAPVVAIDDLPVGAARAAIVLHEEAEKGLRLTVVLRLVRTGQVLFFAPDRELAGASDSAPDLDAALSFAEAMGFLFDDAVEARIKAQQHDGLIPPLDARRVANALNACDACLVIAAFGKQTQDDPEAVLETMHRIWCSTLYGRPPCIIPSVIDSDRNQQDPASGLT